MPKNVILLSHFICKNTPLYGNSGKIEIIQDRSISKGDTCNTFSIVFSNHTGAHIDCPFHFDNEGKKICDYKITDFIFTNPALIDIPKNAGELIIPPDFEKKIIYKICKKADILLIKTDFEKFRGTDKYILNNPGISEEAIRYIRLNFPNVRAVGIDTISISSYMQRQEGKKAHCAALCEKPEILLIEDMRLSEISMRDKLKKLYCIPLFIEEIDASPVTIFAEIKK